MPKEKITIDDLGIMIARGFQGLEDRLGGRIDSLETRFDSLEVKMDAGFAGLQNQLDAARLDYTPRREHRILVERVKKIERNM